MVVQGSSNAVTQQQRSFDSIVAREQGLRHALTSGQMAMIAIGGAIGTGLFLGSGFAIGLAGPSVLVSYAIGALIALLLMGALAEMTVAHPTAGSFGSAGSADAAGGLAAVAAVAAVGTGEIDAIGSSPRVITRSSPLRSASISAATSSGRQLTSMQRDHLT